MKFKEGQRVRLLPFEIEPEQFGTVLGIEGTDVILVEIDKQYRDNLWDDGFREVPVEQVEEINE